MDTINHTPKPPKLTPEQACDAAAQILLQNGVSGIVITPVRGTNDIHFRTSLLGYGSVLDVIRSVSVSIKEQL